MLEQRNSNELNNLAGVNDEPIAEFVANMIQTAIKRHASDIHLEPMQAHCRIRMRCDGLLSESNSISTVLAQRVIARLKILANLNIAERRLPQDGHIHLMKPHINIRISTCPALFGEKIVLRLLAIHLPARKLHALGLEDTQQKVLMEKLNCPQGLILVTGPTGSGKTMTLYAALDALNQIEKNIVTVEDPIEIELNGITQVNVNPKIQLDFATVLRAFLRQDPDIIMLGEIRDLETANIAMQAAQTGHLVLSTLHTNSAIEAITRLQSMGVAVHHLAASLSLVIAQRLVRQLCHHCHTTRTMDTDDMYQEQAGCADCYHGYVGRTGIFELLTITDSMSQLICEGATYPALRQQTQKEEMLTLWQAGIRKVIAGVTSQAELYRVLGNYA